jgi:hypothetical protein
VDFEHRDQEDGLTQQLFIGAVCGFDPRCLRRRPQRSVRRARGRPYRDNATDAFRLVSTSSPTVS